MKHRAKLPLTTNPQTEAHFDTMIRTEAAKAGRPVTGNATHPTLKPFSFEIHEVAYELSGGMFATLDTSRPIQASEFEEVFDVVLNVPNPTPNARLKVVG